MSYKLNKPQLGSYIDFSDPLTEGLVGCWLFNEGTGDILNDLSKNENTGTIYNATWAASEHGGCLSCNGTTSYVNCGGGSTLDVSAMTIEIGIISEDTASYSRVIAKGVSSPSANIEGYQIYWSGSELWYNMGNGVGTGVRVSMGNVFDGNLHIITGTWDGVTMNTYTDGEYVASGSYSGDPSNSVDLCIGSASGPSDFLDGSIFFVLLYNRVLSTTEIEQLYINPYRMFNRRKSRWTILKEALVG